MAERGLAHQKHSKISRLLPPSLAVCTTFMCHFQMRFILLSIACAVSIVVEVLSAFAQTSGVGSIPGSFDVTLSGSASYSIPIKIPPDAAGTEPKIQLVYDSQSIGGPLGAGWSIAGLSIITSGPNGQFTDNMIDAVRLLIDPR